MLGGFLALSYCGSALAFVYSVRGDDLANTLARTVVELCDLLQAQAHSAKFDDPRGFFWVAATMHSAHVRTYTPC